MTETRGLWRGKCKLYHNYETEQDISEWVYGVPLRHCDGDWQIISGKGGAMILRTVDPSTLGECTGLRDKNGKPIFEGDIVHIFGGEHYDCVYECDEIIVVKDITDGICVYMEAAEYMEVIGNIHDNPELLNDRHKETGNDQERAAR